uniref:DUF6824 domain-containing protein n=1 Tax=Craspedostauros australis TaxID=1486917 RepID=A0A7R9WLQ8_9STRA
MAQARDVRIESPPPSTRQQTSTATLANNDMLSLIDDKEACGRHDAIAPVKGDARVDLRPQQDQRHAQQRRRSRNTRRKTPRNTRASRSARASRNTGPSLRRRNGVVHTHYRYADVLCERGTRAHEHVGNQFYHRQVLRRFYRYRQNAEERNGILQEIYEEIREVGGRFVEEDDHNGLFYVISEESSIEIIRQCFRSTQRDQLKRTKDHKDAEWEER